MDSEPFVTQCILNEVVRTNFQTDGDYILTGIVSQVTFFGNELGIQVTSFNDLFQPVLFGDVEFGLAGNVWAEMLAAGGWPLLGCFLLAFVLALRVLSRWLHAVHVSTQACVALSAAHFAFYIHRTDVCFQLTLQKRLLACWFLIVLASEVLHVLAGRRGGRTDRRPVASGRSPGTASRNVTRRLCIHDFLFEAATPVRFDLAPPRAAPNASRPCFSGAWRRCRNTICTSHCSNPKARSWISFRRASSCTTLERDVPYPRSSGSTVFSTNSDRTSSFRMGFPSTC